LTVAVIHATLLAADGIQFTLERVTVTLPLPPFGAVFAFVGEIEEYVQPSA